MVKKEPFEKYVQTLNKTGVFKPVPNSISGRIVSPLFTQTQMLQTRLEMRFDYIDFDSKTVLDIGAGTGLFSAYAAHKGAERVVALEPEVDGSSAGMIDTLEDLAVEYPCIDIIKKTLQEYNPNAETFDVVISNNSINHLDEEACMELKHSEQARETYNNIFDNMNDIMKPGGALIIADAFPQNIWNDIGISNPFITLEWQKHQSPNLWISLLRDHGFEKHTLIWDSYLSQLGTVGRQLFCNYTLSYMTYSKFILKLRKNNE
jgi:SAM-dependent methyltransferase